MMTPEPTRHTIREQIMQYLVETFKAPGRPGELEWGIVTRDPITKHSLQNECHVVGLYDTRETVQEGANYEIRTVNVIIEFHVRLAEGDVQSTYLNHCLGNVVQRVARDITCGRLALNTRETMSELDIEGAFDKYASGVCAFDVSYRCRPNDPYSRV